MTKFAENISDMKYTAGEEIERSSKKFMRNMVPADKKLRILDIGCGTGRNAQKLAQKGHDVIGIDISSVAINKIKEKGLQAYRCDITKGIIFDNDSFEMIYASEIIEHLVDYDYFLKECYRVLKPNGQLLLSTVNSSFWAFRLLSLFGKTVSETQHPGHLRFFSLKGLSKHIKEAGFKVIGISGRHIFLILYGKLACMVSPLLTCIGMKEEIRFKTMKPFWHFSKFVISANNFWADTLIVSAVKE